MSDLPTPQPPEPPLPPETPRATNENSWALLIHLSALLHLLGATFPGANVVGPLVLWLIKRNDSPYLDEVGKRVLNFQISWAIYFAIVWAAIAILVWILVGFLLIPVAVIMAIVWLIITIIGAMKESNGEPYRFPWTIQFLK
jgi:uncharacterized Tic20 family protein